MGELAGELRLLCRGRGVMSADLAARVGPVLWNLLGLGRSAGTAEIRPKLISYLTDLSVQLPPDLRAALVTGLALDGSEHTRFLKQRIERHAARWFVSERTVQRLVSDAILATECLAASAPSANGDYAPSGWYLARFRAAVSLDGATPSVLEERELVATADDLREILISTSVPRATARDNEHDVSLEILFGGSLSRTERRSTTYFRYFVRLPHPLRLGETHQLAVRATIPLGQPMNPRYSFQPLRRCDEFDLRIRFGAAARARRVWRLAGVPRGLAEDLADQGALIPLDESGEAHLSFKQLQVGLAYGARWES